MRNTAGGMIAARAGYFAVDGASDGPISISEMEMVIRIAEV